MHNEKLQSIMLYNSDLDTVKYVLEPVGDRL